MLGQEDVFGKFYCSVDDKNRLILPAATKAEHKEELLVVSRGGATKYIVDREYFDDYVERIRKRLENPLNKSDLDELFELYESLCDMVIKQVRVDASRRILLTDVLKPNSSAEITGMGKILRIDKNKKTRK